MPQQGQTFHSADMTNPFKMHGTSIFIANMHFRIRGEKAYCDGQSSL